MGASVADFSRNPTDMMFSKPQKLALLFVIALGAVVGFVVRRSTPTKEAGTARPSTASREISSVPTDRPIAAFKADLLDRAFRAASALPIAPHVKTRSRSQESVVAAALELDQPTSARGFADRIHNWRRGAAYAEIGVWYAERKCADEARKLFELADKVALESAQSEKAQDWQVDRIRSRIAAGYLLLGDGERSAKFAAGMVDSEAARVNAVRARAFDPKDFDAQLAAFDSMFSIGNFEQVKSSLEMCTDLFDRFYDDAAKRAALESRIKTAYSKLPAGVRIDLLSKAAATATKKENNRHSLDLIETAAGIMRATVWAPGDEVPLRSRLALLRFRAGDVERAKAELVDAVHLFESKAPEIVDIERAGALRPLAEAHEKIGDHAGALALYRRALEEGVKNPNSRPRAEDLCATALSMALANCEPDQELRDRLNRVADGLGDPW